MKPSLGNQEIELLKYISDHSEPIPVRDIIEQFGEPHGLARTTVLTMLDRLLKKGFILRETMDGVYHYISKTSKSELLQEMVKDFVEKTLGGSLSPVVNYLVQDENLSRMGSVDTKRLEEQIAKIHDEDRPSPEKDE